MELPEQKAEKPRSTSCYCGLTPSSRQMPFDWPQILTIASFENINSSELMVQNGSILNFVLYVCGEGIDYKLYLNTL